MREAVVHQVGLIFWIAEDWLDSFRMGWDHAVRHVDTLYFYKI